MNKDEAAEIFRRHFMGTASPAEKQWIAGYVSDDTNAAQVQSIMEMIWQDYAEPNDVFEMESRNRLFTAIRSVDSYSEPAGENRKFPSRVHRIYLLKTAWLKYAAAVLVIVGMGAYLLMDTSKDSAGPVGVSQAEKVPGGNKATLTLGDGSRLILDSAANGKLARQGATVIHKSNDGQVAYRTEPGVTTVSFNTMATPRGGQYSLTLPDGTGVWLNAASAITFPTAFNSGERKISIQGEVYFEVAKNKTMPFVVDINGKNMVQVLGTSFNINAYDDEPVIRTTLIDGSIKILTNKKSAVLQPNQEAVFRDQQLKVIERTNIDMVLAWRSGSFQFERTSIDEVLRQLARWYDVDVSYEKKVPVIYFSGAIKRNLNLAQALLILEKMGVACRIEGRKLIVM